MDNQNLAQSPRASQLRPPSKIPSMFGSRGLNDLSDSENNTRIQSTMMPPPSVALKHKPSNLPEPPTKRKTLAERAGEVQRNGIPAPPSSRPVNGSVKTLISIGSRSGTASTTGSRSQASSISSGWGSRNVSNSSLFNGSIGSGSRPQSAQTNCRPQSAMSQNRTAFQAANAATRPQTFIEHHAGAVDYPTSPGRRKGTLDFITISPRRRRRHEATSDPIYSADDIFSRPPPSNPFRAVSITSGMQNLTLRSEPAASGTDICPDTPSYIPKAVPLIPEPSPTPTKRIQSKSPERAQYLNRFTNTTAAFDPTTRFEEFEQNLKQIYAPMERIEQSLSDRNALQEQVTLQKARIQEQESRNTQLSATNDSLHISNQTLQSRNNKLEDAKEVLQSQLEHIKDELRDRVRDLDESRRQYSLDVEDLNRRHRIELEDTQEALRKQTAKFRREAENEVVDLERSLRSEIEEEKAKRLRDAERFNIELAATQAAIERRAAEKDSESQSLKTQLTRLEAELEHERSLREGLKSKLLESSGINTSLESSMQAMKAKIEFLESGNQAQSQEFANLKRREQEAIARADEIQAKLRAEETLRRKLHNQVQELKGNIRVFCRVRPPLDAEVDEVAKIAFPDDGEDSKEVVIMGPETKTALGNVSTSKNGFSFDRVFGPSSQNSEIFEEISQLVQSALDGYNVCIFCYGQTGSGKTHTMSSEDGMIPLAVHQIYQTAEDLKEKGWSYTMEGSFVEVYNETLNDLLGSAEDIDKKKLEIRHDLAKGKTTISDVNTVILDSPNTLTSILKRAQKNRSVAATKANERSSRSHSVFILKLTGTNPITGEKSEGTLNLVDLAGSERLAHSQATGDRLRETQNINKSLSSLGDVISALGQGKDGQFVPYRNSKLTFLLQMSLGGNSKTLMFVMISPLKAHLSETITSLKFATKVHNTHIGTAKKQTRIKDS